MPENRERDLPPAQREALHEAASHLRSRGAAILLLGGAGADRTLAAEALAEEAGLSVYRIDLSTIISKYIGETEKNLDRVFEEVRDRDAVLFFDEADALFGRRAGVRDGQHEADAPSHRFLRHLEHHRGPVVFAAESREGLGEDLLGRLSFVVDLLTPPPGPPAPKSRPSAR